jgi:hypothetical protein
MTKGIANVEYVRQGSEVTVADQPNWSFIYRTSLVKDDRWTVGDRVVLPDGREFRYAKSAAACISGQGCEFTSTGYTAYTAVIVSQAVGDTQITVAAATHAILAQDELRGGYIVVYNGTNNNVQFRGIIGNDAAVANATFKVYLDGPLTEVVVASTSATEVFVNPYAALQTGTSAALAKAGTPAVLVAAALTYFWVQIAGPSWMAPQALLTGKQRGACWRHDGSLDTASAGIDAANAQFANVASQYAGFSIAGSADGNGPLFMLQG